MDYFLTHLVFELELNDFGITYEDLVPIACKTTHSSVDSFSSTIERYISTPDEILHSKIRSIADLYWDVIKEEEKEFRKLKPNNDYF